LNVAAQSLFATFFPSECRICNAPLNKVSRLPVCDDCLSALHPIDGPQCALCGERLMTVFGDGICSACRVEEPPFVRALAYGSYESGLREMIHLLKYEHVRPAAGVLGRMLGEVIQELAAEFKAAIVVPVPLHPSKLRQRGFNQAEEIAKVALKQLKSSRLQLTTGALLRRRATETQTGLSRAQRLENIRGAFSVKDGEKLKVSGCDIVLVDDVFTTGTTVSECARVLKRAGAARVFVATVARVLKAEATFVNVPEELEPEQAMAVAAGT
jgi:ComF family protein